MTHKKRINEQCDSIHCAKKQDNDAQHEPKQSDLMRCGDLHLRIQDITETSFIFDGDTNNANLQNFLQAETINAEKNNSYYQRYYVKQLRTFHKQAMIKQQIYDNIFARRSGMEYIQGINFQTSLVNMEEAKGLKMNNQQKH